ncbi:MAG TPA: dTDP-4-dehydrorhamnose reductase, partial [Pseudomonas sp.]|nr:dTDP-4-dehydrorhamnose reductase [Pseudomonas sp.]
MKILITGQHGQVSQALQQQLQGLGELIVLGREHLDLADAKRIRQQVRAHRPDLIISAA